MAKHQVVLNKIDDAKRDVARAEAELERLMANIEEAPRAEKTTVSEGLQQAFALLRAARTDLAVLESLLSDPDDPIA